MHVVIVGCGRVGSGLARSLDEAGHSVVVVDRRSKAFTRLPDDFGGRTVVGVGFDRDLLTEAGIQQADALAAVTSGDNSNILVARVARETFEVGRVVARIYDPRRAAIYERLGIPTVATVQWTTERVLRRILQDDPGIDWTDASARVCLLERQLPSAWAGKPVKGLDLPGQARVVAVARLGAAQIPPDDLVAQDGDVLHVAVGADDIDAYDAHLAGGQVAGGHA
jgi:trk system potassium uptake protein TrkA